MTIIIDDKDASHKEYNNPEITKLDIEICCIRKIPLPRIVNHIYRSSPDSDIWLCENCKTRGDKWYLMIHLCKASRSEKPKTQLEIRQAEEEIQRRLEASKWICPYCNEVTDRFYKKLHYRCLPEDKKRELEKEEESKFERCPTCNKLLDPFYKNFHICSVTNIKTESEYNKSKPIKQQIPTHKHRVNHWNRFRRRRRSLRNGSDLGHFMRHKAVLEGEYWVLYIDGKRIGPVEKATKEELTSWDPKTDEKH